MSYLYVYVKHVRHIQTSITFIESIPHIVCCIDGCNISNYSKLPYQYLLDCVIYNVESRRTSSEQQFHNTSVPLAK
jgi:hypothetical protein